MKRPLRALGTALGVVCLPNLLAAQGFGVYEHGTCTMARAGTGVAAPCSDGSAMLFNPAGLGGIGRGLLISAGLTVIDARGDFTDDLTATSTDLANDPIPVPHGYIAYGVNDKLAAGVGVFVPYGLGTKWPLTFDGRFNGYDNDLRSIYVQPTVSYRVHSKVAVGAGLDFVTGAVELNQRLDLSSVPVPGQPITFGQLGVPFHTEFANAQIRATGATGFGGHFGVLVDLTDRLHLGARYLTQVTLDYDGRAAFDPVPTGIKLPPGNPLGVPPGTSLDLILATRRLFDADSVLGRQPGTASITMPAQFVAGVAVDVSNRLRLLADYQFTQWSVFDTLVLDFANAATPDIELIESYQDAHGARFGFEYRSSDRVTLRGGYLYHTEASPPQTVTPLLPEGVRNEFTGGVGIALGPSVTADVAYQYIRQNDRRGRVRDAPEGQAPTVDLNSGLYSFLAHLVGVTFTIRF